MSSCISPPPPPLHSSLPPLPPLYQRGFAFKILYCQPSPTPPRPSLAASLPAKCNFSSRAAAAASAKPTNRREKKEKKKRSPGPRRLKDVSDSNIIARFWNRYRITQQSQTKRALMHGYTASRRASRGAARHATLCTHLCPAFVRGRTGDSHEQGI